MPTYFYQQFCLTLNFIVSTNKMKLIAISLLLLVWGVHNLHLQQHQQNSTFDNTVPRIRRNIFALNSTARKGFFWSLKALAVLPAPASFNYWAVDNLLFFDGDNTTSARYFTPYARCLHDILIAEHETSGEHVSFYFPSFHRHWIVHYEIWLNFAHSVLSGGKQKLLQHYSQQFYDQFSQKWDIVFDQYKREGMDKITEMAAHYWNPTDFSNRDQVQIPIEVLEPRNGRQPDHMDNLMFAVREHYAWESNVRTRLTAKNYPYNKDEVVTRMRKANYLNPVDLVVGPYSPEELSLMNGKLSAREQPEGKNYESFTQTYDIFNTGNIFGGGDFKNHSNARLEEYFNRTGERMSIYNMTDEELFTVFGGDYMMEVDGEQKLVRHSYVTKQERRGLNLPYHAVVAFNKKIPHYLYAYALFNRMNTPDYMAYYRDKTGVADSHYMMHGYHGLLLQEVLNLNIFVFHGWVELEFEMRIRKENYEDKLAGNKKNYETLRRYLKEKPMSEQRNHFINFFVKAAPTQAMKDELQEAFDRDLRSLHANISRVNGYMIDEPLLPNETGYYPVYEWTNPIFLEQVIANQTFDPNGFPNCTIVLPIRDYMITPERLRTCQDLAQIYNKIYVPLSQDRFKGFVDLSKHRYNFNYEIYNGPNEPLELLNEDGTNIPKYLQAMKKDIQFESYDIFDSNINTTINYLYQVDFSSFNNQDPAIDKLFQDDPIANHHIIKKKLITHYTSYLHNTTYSYAEYPPSKKSGMYEIRLKLDSSNECEDLEAKLRSFGFNGEQIKQITSEGIPLQLLNVTNKPGCVDCLRRRIYLDTDVDLLETNFPLWRALRKVMTGESSVLVEGGKKAAPTSFTQCFAKNTKLFVPGDDGEDSDFLVEPVQGSQTINFVVQVIGKPPASIIYVNATTVYDGETGHKGFRGIVKNGTTITLPLVNHANNGAIKNDLHSTLYTHLDIQWMAGYGGLITMEYSVPHFSVRADYKVVVDFSDAENGSIRLEDLDHAFKRQLFSHYHEEFY